MVKARIISAIVFLAFAQVAWAQNTLRFDENTVINTSGGVVIQLTDTDLENNGRLIGRESEFVFRGTLPQIFIGGQEITEFGNLTLNGASTNFILGQSIRVNQDLTLSAGNLDLQNFTLTLPSPESKIEGETSSNRIFSELGGSIIKYLLLESPENVDPGNLGFRLTSLDDLGFSEIHRTHEVITLPTGESVQRNYKLVPEFEPQSTLALDLGYFDAEANGLTNDEIQVWNLVQSGWEAQTTTLSEDGTSGLKWAKIADVNLANRYTIGLKKDDEPTTNLPNTAPTAFTPNGDGVNDVFIIPEIYKHPEASVTIINRWGEIVYATTDYLNKPWDGTFNGDPVVVATYFYLVKFEDQTLGDVRGEVSIVR